MQFVEFESRYHVTNVTNVSCAECSSTWIWSMDITLTVCMHACMRVCTYSLPSFLSSSLPLPLSLLHPQVPNLTRLIRERVGMMQETRAELETLLSECTSDITSQELITAYIWHLNSALYLQSHVHDVHALIHVPQRLSEWNAIHPKTVIFEENCLGWNLNPQHCVLDRCYAD